MQRFHRDETGKSKLLLAPIAKAAATFYTEWFDRQDNDEYGGAEFQTILGATTGTPTSFTVTSTVQSSDDKSTIVTADDYAGNDLEVVQDTADTMKSIHFSPESLGRYFRLKTVVAFSGGSSPTIVTGTVLNMSDARRVPVDSTALATE